MYNVDGGPGKSGGNIVSANRSPVRHLDDDGPFDIIGDVHGCFWELMQLLGRLGYARVSDAAQSVGADAVTTWRDEPDSARLAHRDGRRVVFLGDITDRGPDSISCILVVEAMVRHGTALYVPGNHCRKLYRYLTGHNVVLQHGIETTAAQLDQLSSDERSVVSGKFRALYEGASVHLVLDNGRLVVAHAGIKETMFGQTSRRIQSFCLFGDTTGERTEDGLPVRRDWARRYEGEALIVYGHTPVREAIFRYNTVNIDQGCVFGGQLTALRYPERELACVDAATEYDPGGVFQQLEPEPAKHQ